MTAEDRQYYLEVAEREIYVGNYAEAERLTKELLSSTDPSIESECEHHAKAVHRLGIIAAMRGDYSLALEQFSRALALSEQQRDRAGVARALGGFGNVHNSLSDYSKALEYHSRALSLHEELGSRSGMAIDLGNIGTTYKDISDYPRALECYTRALNLDEELDNRAGVARHLGGIGLVHAALSDYSQALEFYAKSLSINEELGSKDGLAECLGKIGAIHSILLDYPKALEYYTQAMSLYESLGSKAGVSAVLGNIGAVHHRLSDHTKTLEYYARALSLSEEIDNKTGVAIWLCNIGQVHEEQGDNERALEKISRGLLMFEELGRISEVAEARACIGGLYARTWWSGRDEAKAESYLLESIALNHKLGTKKYDAHKTLAELYENQERWAEAYYHIVKYFTLKEEVLNEEARKKAQLMEQQKQIAEREKEIAIAKAASEAQMSATTKLLYKVLPQSVASRMIDGDEEIADYYPQVSILFADIAGFTPISADMPAIIVVRFLNFVFGEFDRIIKKHGCEKIKTIGDGYMAVCGAPLACDDHAERLAAAALEMQETISLPESIREYMPSNVKLGVRIGLHTGSVVAGVIGEERFVYDIYSDAVNTAARMESHGEENKIHVSNDFFRHLQNLFAMTKNTTHGFVFEKRGEMEIKGKGMMRTYFLEKK